MGSISHTKYTYLCPHCGESRNSLDHIPICKVCGEFYCKKCEEKSVCSSCLGKLNAEQKKIFNKKGKKTKILTQIFREIYGPNFILARERTDYKDEVMAVAKKIWDRTDGRAEFQKLRDKRVPDTHNPDLWK